MLRGRRGIETLELIVVLPVLAIVTVALLEFGILVLTYQTIVAASAEAAREAAKAEMTVVQREAAANAAAQEFLSVHNFSYGDVTLTFQNNTPATGYVSVNIVIALTDANIPDWLSTFGIGLGSREFDVTSVAPLE